MGPEDKRVLRKIVRARLADVPVAEKERRSAEICRSLKAHIAINDARVVALFSPLPDEPMIGALIDELSKRMAVLLPRVEGDTMEFYLYSPELISCGAFGIMEPAGGVAVAPGEIDIMLVPGVAFTPCGDRIGRGKGFYDRYMSRNDFRALKIGVCYAEQLIESIPMEPHDMKMDFVVYK